MTKGWSAQPYQQRLQAGGMGDEAEQKFEEVHDESTWVRFGFNRPPFRMTNLSSFIRHTPDYVTKQGALVECMGMGRDGVLKLKLEKYEALMEWNRKQPVVLFVWNSAEGIYLTVYWDELKLLVSRARRDAGVRAFNDGNEYYPISFDWMTE